MAFLFNPNEIKRILNYYIYLYSGNILSNISLVFEFISWIPLQTKKFVLVRMRQWCSPEGQTSRQKASIDASVESLFVYGIVYSTEYLK